MKLKEYSLDDAIELQLEENSICSCLQENSSKCFHTLTLSQIEKNDSGRTSKIGQFLLNHFLSMSFENKNCKESSSSILEDIWKISIEYFQFDEANPEEHSISHELKFVKQGEKNIKNSLLQILQQSNPFVNLSGKPFDDFLVILFVLNVKVSLDNGKQINL